MRHLRRSAEPREVSVFQSVKGRRQVADFRAPLLVPDLLLLVLPLRLCDPGGEEAPPRAER